MQELKEKYAAVSGQRKANDDELDAALSKLSMYERGKDALKDEKEELEAKCKAQDEKIKELEIANSSKDSTIASAILKMNKDRFSANTLVFRTTMEDVSI